MNEISRTPAISRSLRTWRVPPGMSFSVVADADGALWIVESCPAGSKFWTVEQADQLPKGERTGPALASAIEMARSIGEKGVSIDAINDSRDTGTFLAVETFATARRAIRATSRRTTYGRRETHALVNA